MPYPGDNRQHRLADVKLRSGGITGFTSSRFIAEDSKATMKNVALVAKLAAFLVPLFLLLDYAVYPEHFVEFLYLRAGCVAMILAVLYCSGKRWARRMYRIFAMSVPMICAAFIALMINRVHDPATPYYAGLNLCLLAIGALLHWTYLEAIMSSCLIFGMYALACASSLGEGLAPESISIFANNCLFLGATSLVVVIGSYAHYGSRIKEFLSRTRYRRNQIVLKEVNDELKGTLEALQETEGQLIQSEKMVFLGQMSAGIIHEIGNPLNFSNQALFVLRKKLLEAGVDERTSEVLDDMQDGLDRIKNTVSEMREFSHSGKVGGKVFPLSASVESAMCMLGREIERTNTTIRVSVDSELKVYGNKNQITQVVINLAHNALQAMASVDSESRILQISGTASLDNCVSLTVTDNGPGIPPEDVPRLFDPFFTTKDPGEGTGLGLSVSFRIIEAHAGTIRVDSPSGKGTVFTIMLPMCLPTVEQQFA